VTYKVKAISNLINWTTLYTYASGQAVGPGVVTVQDNVGVTSAPK
jgi:hypothetical protein